MSEYLKRVSLKEAQDTLVKIQKAKTYGIVKETKELRTIHRNYKRGYTDNNEARRRFTFRAPLWILFHPEYMKYFDKNATEEERKVDMTNFFKLPYIQTPWGEKIDPKTFLVIDKL